jgi:RNA recognition motif-containing protein
LLTTFFSQVHIPIDSISKQPKGLAYATFKQPTSALSAYEALDKRSFQGRLLHIIPAVDRKGKFEVVDGEGKKKTLKDERSSRRKATASREFNWSMLYMNVREAFVILHASYRDLMQRMCRAMQWHRLSPIEWALQRQIFSTLSQIMRQ